MRIENIKLIWTLMPVFLSGVDCGTWRVVYPQRDICVVNGSFVVIPCLFDHPYNLRVKNVMWYHVKSRPVKSPLVYDSSSNKVPTRFQYIGDQKNNCSLKMDQVDHNDAGKYVFRFTTNSENGKWTGRPGPTLKIVDLKIFSTRPDGVRATEEGDSVNLTCVNVCDKHSSAFIWFKNGEPINEGPVLYLNNVSSTNSGNYTCSLRRHTETSGVLNIDVEYGPKNTSVSVRGSMEGDFSSNITLICSSHANPPVENYTWFKIDDEDDNVDIMDVGPWPEFLPADGGQYLCSATNKHGSQNSSVVTVKIRKYWAPFGSDVIIIATVAVLLIVIAVVTLRRLHKKRIWIPKPENEDDIQNTDYVNWLPYANNHTQERHPCEGGTEEVVYSTVYYKKSNTELPTDSHPRVDESVIYISVSEANC
uniref:Ig-like domain-containing protein n=1 Tax=Gasterosteus aculeatus aculeatus TaxID=481459 RepID=A0AAQ4QNV5_GASAC|nr:B-cell receptor CD22-like [Gasterosteus aculeatus aculeatus]